MKKLHVKLLQHHKAANKRDCLSYRKSEGKPYYTHHYTEDREMSWCDVAFKRGKKVYNCTFYEKGIDCFGADRVVYLKGEICRMIVGS